MKLPSAVTLREGETLKLLTKPHPLGFGRYYALAIVYLVLAGALRLAYASNYVTGMTGLATNTVTLGLWWVVLLIPALISGLLWVSKQPLLYSILVGAGGTALLFGYGDSALTLPLLLGVASILGIVLTDVYRRSHKYVITDQRLVVLKSFGGFDLRELQYDRITDLSVKRSLLGRILHFGTIIPISESGFGLGQDTAGAGAAAAVQKSGIMFGGGVFGSKGVETPRAATYYSLYDVPKVMDVYNLLSGLIHQSSQAPYLKRIEQLLEAQSGVKQEAKPVETSKEQAPRKDEEKKPVPAPA